MTVTMAAQRLRAMEGTDLASDIDQGFEDLAQDVSDRLSVLTYSDCEGVRSIRDFKIVETSGTSLNTQISEGAGVCWIRDDDSAVDDDGAGVANPLVPVTMDTTTLADFTAVHSTAHATLPRIDLVVMQLLDTAEVGELQVVTGTPTATADLDNRLGAPALPDSALHLADVLVGAAATNVATADIRDRRHFRNPFTMPPVFTNVWSGFTEDVPVLAPHPLGAGLAFMEVNGTNFATAGATTAVAVKILVTQRMGVIGFTWNYVQGSVAATLGDYQVNLYDCSSNLEIPFDVEAFTGAAGDEILANVSTDGAAEFIIEPGVKILSFETDTVSAGSGIQAPCFVLEPAAGGVASTGMVADFDAINTFGTPLPTLLSADDFCNSGVVGPLGTGLPFIQLLGTQL